MTNQEIISALRELADKLAAIEIQKNKEDFFLMQVPSTQAIMDGTYQSKYLPESIPMDNRETWYKLNKSYITSDKGMGAGVSGAPSRLPKHIRIKAIKAFEASKKKKTKPRKRKTNARKRH